MACTTKTRGPTTGALLAQLDDQGAVSVHYVPRTTDTSAPASLTAYSASPADRLVFGRGAAAELVAHVSPARIQVRSALTADVVAEMHFDSPPTSVEFDLHLIAVVLGGRVCIADMNLSDDERTWHPMCSAARVSSVVVEWPRVVAMGRSGQCIWWSDLGEGVTDASAHASLSVVNEAGALESREHRRLAAPCASTDSDPCLVGKLACVDGVLSWLGLSGDTRQLVLNKVLIAGVAGRHREKVLRQRLPWPAAHSALYPNLDRPAEHCTTESVAAAEARTIHVVVWTKDPATLQEHQLLQTVAGRWHKTHVVAGSSRVVALSPSDEPFCMGVVHSNGGYALVTTTADVREVPTAHAQG